MAITSNAECKEGHALEGHATYLGDFGKQEFHLTYAGWDEQWIVQDLTKPRHEQDMVRATAQELAYYLVH